MFCPNCGAQNPDGSNVCQQCGTALAEQPQQASQPVQQEAQPVSQPVQQEYQQPVSQPVQPQYQQPQYGAQPQYGQPAYGQPYAQPRAPRAPMNPKTKKTIIIASVCAVLLATFLILLFAVIIPSSGYKGKMRHRWREYGYSSTDYVLDLKSNVMTEDGVVQYKITDWNFKDDRFTVSAQNPNNPLDVRSTTFAVAFSTDGMTMYLIELETPSYVSKYSGGIALGYDPDDVEVYVRVD